VSAVGLAVDDDVVVSLEMATPALSQGEQQPMQVQDEADAQLSRVLLVQVVEGGRIASELGLATVPESIKGAGDELGDPRIVNDDALDRARGGDGLDARLLAQGVEKLGQLIGVSCLGARGAIDTAQRRYDATGHRFE